MLATTNGHSCFHPERFIAFPLEWDIDITCGRGRFRPRRIIRLRSRRRSRSSISPPKVERKKKKKKRRRRRKKKKKWRRRGESLESGAKKERFLQFWSSGGDRYSPAPVAAAAATAAQPLPPPPALPSDAGIEMATAATAPPYRLGGLGGLAASQSLDRSTFSARKSAFFLILRRLLHSECNGRQEKHVISTVRWNNCGRR